MRLEPHAIARAGRAAAARSRHLRHQRQDHDRRDGRLGARARRHRARPQPRRSEHGRRRRSTLLDGARAGGSDRRRARAVRGRRVLARPGRRRSCTRGPCCSATCSATSSTATASSRRSPIAGRRSSPSTCPADAAGAERRRSADRRPRPRATPDVTYFGVEDPLDGAAGDAARLGLQALPALRRRVRLRRDLPRSPRASTTAPTAGSAGPTPRSRAEQIALHGTRGARFTLRTPAGTATVSSRSRASTTSTTRSAPRRSAWRSGSSSSRSSPASRRSPPLSAAPSGRDRRRELSILLIKNPAGANEILRTLTLESGSSTCSASSTTAPPTATTSPGSGTPTSSCSPAASAQRHLRGHPRGRARAAAQIRRHRHRPPARRAGAPQRPRRRRSPRPPSGACTRCPPTRRCSSCATSSPRRGHVGQFWAPKRPCRDERDLARPRVRRATPRTCALWRSLAATTASPCSTSAPAPAGSRSTSLATVIA